MFKAFAQWAYSEQGFTMKNGEKDLSIEKDEELEVLEDLQNGWFRAKKADGKIGVVPGNYMQRIEKEDFDEPPPAFEDLQASKPVQSISPTVPNTTTSTTSSTAPQKSSSRSTIITPKAEPNRVTRMLPQTPIQGKENRFSKYKANRPISPPSKTVSTSSPSSLSKSTSPPPKMNHSPAPVMLGGQKSSSSSALMGSVSRATAPTLTNSSPSNPPHNLLSSSAPSTPATPSKLSTSPPSNPNNWGSVSKASGANIMGSVSKGSGSLLASSSSVNLKGSEEISTTPKPQLPPEEYSICVLGGQCGKSALVVRLLYNKFSDVDEPTVEDNYTSEIFYEGATVKLKILDTSGSDDYASFRSNWFSKSQGFVFVYSIASEASFQQLNGLFDAVVKSKGNDKFPCVLVGTQADNSSKRKVLKKQGKDRARKYNCPFVEASALTGENVTQIFEAIIDELRYGKKKDTFVQDFPFYRNKWNELIQLSQEDPILTSQIPNFKHETGTAIAINQYIFPHNIDDAAASNSISLTAATEVFGVSLDECMQKQKHLFPELPIPRILVHLVDAFYFMKGQTQEGIFRQAPFPEEFKKLKEEIDRGNYDIISYSTNIHTVTSLFKLFLRQLKDPLIPVTLYNAAIYNTMSVQKVLELCPQVNLKTILFVASFLNELCADEIVAKTRMDKSNLALVLAPSFLRFNHKDPAEMLSTAEKEKLFTIEIMEYAPKKLEKPRIATIPHTILFEHEEKYIPYYNEYFYLEKEHVDFMGKDDKGQPLAASVAIVEGRETYRALVMTKEDTYRIMIPACKDKDMPDMIKKSAPGELKIDKLKPAKSQKKLSKELLQFEMNQVANNYKWGVLLWLDGQNEDQMYANVNTTPDFEEFLEFIGKKIVLKDWSKFRGGLDAKKNATGTHSYYTEYHDMEIMYHVAPLLPFFANDPQQLERKRHLGNDIIVIIFKESKSPFDPTMMRSEFNHIFVVVSKVDKSVTGTDKTHYKIAIECKEGVPPFGPPIPYPAIFEKNEAFREFFLTKLINGERGALHGCPSFKNKMITVRRTNLETLDKSFGGGK